jgi:hypothetical protein
MVCIKMIVWERGNQISEISSKITLANFHPLVAQLALRNTKKFH